jgi:hypothetical protein
MRFFLYMTFTVILSAQYLSSIHALPAAFKFLPELTSLVAIIMFTLRGIQQRFRYMATKYWLIFGSIAIVMLCGIIANGVGTGPIITGMRYYMRAAPFFLAAAVFDFEDWQIKQMLKFLLVFSLIQAPLAVYQRISLEAAFTTSGDYVYGTMMLSGTLSLFLMSVECLLTAALLRGMIKTIPFLVCFLILLVPMSINETKITVFLLPLALLLTVLAGSPARMRLKRTFQGLAMIVIAGSVFVPLYDYYSKLHQSDSNTIMEFLTKKGVMSEYLETNAGVGSDKEAGRVDSIVVPLQVIARDPVTLAFGLGLGNVSKSSLGPNFSGAFFRRYWRYGTSVGIFLLECGVLGFGLILLLHWEIARDTFAVIRTGGEGPYGALAVGWLATNFIVTVGLIYIPEHFSEAVSYLFFFFSGVIAARRVRYPRGVSTQDAAPVLQQTHQPAV